jgi:hypothetical protein
MGTVGLNSKLWKISSGGNLTLRFLTWDNLKLNEGKP